MKTLWRVFFALVIVLALTALPATAQVPSPRANGAIWDTAYRNIRIHAAGTSGRVYFWNDYLGQGFDGTVTCFIYDQNVPNEAYFGGVVTSRNGAPPEPGYGTFLIGFRDNGSGPLEPPDQVSSVSFGESSGCSLGLPYFLADTFVVRGNLKVR